MTGPALARAGAVVAGATAVVSVISYAYGIALAHWLPSNDYAVFAAGQTLLLVVGTAASAAVPWALAKAVKAHPAGTAQRRAAMAHALGIGVLGAIPAAAFVGIVTALYAPASAVVAVMAAVVGIMVSGCAVGWLQGEQRFGRLAALRVGEVVARVALGSVAVAVGLGAAGALGAFLLGSVVLFAGAGAWADLSWRPSVLRDRGRWRDTAGLSAVQGLLGVLTATDIVLAPIFLGPGSESAAYQLAATLGRVPLFVAAALAVVAFPRLTDSPGTARETMTAYGWLAFPVAAVLITAPADLVRWIVPAHLTAAVQLLPYTVLTGLFFGLITLAITVLQAQSAYRKASKHLIVALVLVLLGIGIGWQTSNLALGTCLGGLVAAATIARPALLPFAASSIATVILWQASHWVPAWIATSALLGLLAIRRIRTTERPPPGARLRVLHLGFEDPALPGSGGGAVRTHEMNRRLARDHDITVLTTRWPGCVDRVEDGVRYEHVGIGEGRTYLGRIAGYAVALPFVSRRYPADLVVEDFFAPVSSIGAPLWTGRPTVGVVQWLNAREKSRQYRLPFFLVERAGVRTHRGLVAVSTGIAERLSAMNPAARVEVVANGVDAAAFDASSPRGEDVVFVGRLEIAQKGLDLLLTAFAEQAHRLPGALVLAGTGPDEQRLRDMAAGLGIADRVRFAGWVSGAAKYRLLAAARVVAVPSRFETFGMVALEAAACGSPVVAFDIDCLREVVPESAGVLVPAFDTAAYGCALAELAADGDRVRRLGLGGRELARAYSWDRLARAQERVYLAAARDWREV
ncbi:glycosyltransferase involved in cell wall biosynthesis/O-antigen/teichoic acid export membrane protein [Actinokineospora baliensis]|uniref:glycosyltransferase n=1 Tax=Actinokineospora baliensis TaxID=547056 RepID=UPI00195E5ABC|nr:glycosyltransferase [Actinokineospora baliensis]MBM7772611.1 glycosyltransferase involved in cell wall biosynthesis/O-antigen/teichoic acid export membrane protein [Actinokineospora baliensis]